MCNLGKPISCLRRSYTMYTIGHILPHHNQRALWDAECHLWLLTEASSGSLSRNISLAGSRVEQHATYIVRQPTAAATPRSMYTALQSQKGSNCLLEKKKNRNDHSRSKNATYPTENPTTIPLKI